MFKKIVKTFSSSLKINKVRLLLPSYWFKVENLMMLWAQLGANYNNGNDPETFIYPMLLHLTLW